MLKSHILDQPLTSYVIVSLSEPHLLNFKMELIIITTWCLVLL